MRSIRLICALSALGLAVPLGIVSAGDGSGSDNQPVDPPSDPPVITAEVETPDVEEPGDETTTGTAVARIPCSWSAVPATSDQADGLNTIYEVISVIINSVVGGAFVVEVTFYSEDGVLHRFNEANGHYEYEVVADCDAATAPAGWATGDIDWWTDSDPDPTLLLPGARREATRPIGFPEPDLSPADEGVVNLGMWLAVDPAGPFSVEARLGPRVWARSTATLVTTMFDPGNGDPTVSCNGVGTPIPDSARDSIDEGPCGYTYPAAVDGGSMTISSTWSVTWELSDGRTGRDADIVVSTVVPYDVIEIQTVGASG